MVFNLINPRIKTQEINSNKKIHNDAAEDIWSQFSPHIKNFTPEFYFSTQNSKSQQLFHYVVKESVENDRVKYTLKQYKSKKINEKVLLDHINQEKLQEETQNGGKKHRKHDSSSSSSDSSSSSEKLVYSLPKNNLIAYPSFSSFSSFPYYPTVYGVPNIYLPTLASTFGSFNLFLPPFKTQILQIPILKTFP